MIDVFNPSQRVITFAIVDCDMGSKVLEEAKTIGVRGGTIVLGRGTIRNPILVKLGIDECRKEILMMLTPAGMEEKLHAHLTKKFHMEKPNHGILVSILVDKVFGIHDSSNDNKLEGCESMYEVIFTIVERGLGQDVVDAASSAGSTGATIINARGSGIHEKETFFGMTIEPEKEIVMIVISKEKVKEVVEAIESTMHIDDPGKGILFTLETHRVTGLYGDKI